MTLASELCIEASHPRLFSLQPLSAAARLQLRIVHCTTRNCCPLRCCAPVLFSTPRLLTPLLAHGQLRRRSVRLAELVVLGVRGGVLRCVGVLPPSAPPFLSGRTCATRPVHPQHTLYSTEMEGIVLVIFWSCLQC